MRTILTFCLSFLFLSTGLLAQNEFTKVIHEFAEINVEALKENDMEKRLALVHPNLIAMGGGIESYRSILESETEMMKEHKLKIIRAEFGAPGDVIKAGPELHCIVEQKLFIEFAGEPAEQTTKLLAASLDEGETWKFVDLNQHDASSIKVFFPYYSEDLMTAFEE